LLVKHFFNQKTLDAATRLCYNHSSSIGVTFKKKEEKNYET